MAIPPNGWFFEMHADGEIYHSGRITSAQALGVGRMVLSSTQGLGFDDARTIFTIVGECLELWADPVAWQTHLLRRAARFAHCRVGLCYEVKDEPGETAARMLSAADDGWLDASERRTLVDGLSHRRLSYSPLWKSFAAALSRDQPRAFCQRDLVDDRCWHASEMYDVYVRPTRIGQGLMSGAWMPHRSSWSVWCLTSDRSDHPLVEAQRCRVSQLHRQIAPLIGTRLCAPNQRSLEGLTRLRRQILDQLLAGRTEQEIADGLHRSRAAVHEHTAYLYEHFAVRSRSQLSAYFIRRMPADRAELAPFDPAKHWLDRRPQLQNLTYFR